jgi:FkbM family methyltransferase
MLRLLHHILSRNRVTSRIQRHIVHRVKDLLNMPDGYYSMGQIYRKIKPAAILDIGLLAAQLHAAGLRAGSKDSCSRSTPDSAAVLRRRMNGRPNVQVHEIALGDTTGIVSFHLNVGEQTNSLLDNLAPGQSPYDPVQQHLSQVQVQAMTLDEWAAKFEPNGMLLIKADIQGAERLLVAGGKKTFAERVAAFYTEICILPQYENQTSLCELNQTMVEELGFALFDIYPCTKDELGRAAFTDVMWVKPAALPLGG